MIFFLEILQILIDVARWIIIAQFVLSILIVFNVINTYNDFVRSLWQGLEAITEPVYRPIRRILPRAARAGGIDFAPLVVIVLLWILRDAAIPAIYRAWMGAPI